MRKVLYILGKLQDSDLQWLLEAGAARPVSKGAVLIEEGQPIESLFIVVEGEFSVEKAGAELARLDVGEVVGEMSFLDARPPSATVTALGDALVFAVPQSRLRSKLRTDPEFAARFYHAMCLFLADRLDRTDTMIGKGRRVAEGGKPARAGEISADAMDSVFLAGTRFNWFLDRVRGR
jgi:CRP-like cAMP-binding protein